MEVDLIFDGNCSELEKQSDERRKVFQENEELQAAIDELNEDMAYGKQRCVHPRGRSERSARSGAHRHRTNQQPERRSGTSDAPGESQ